MKLENIDKNLVLSKISEPNVRWTNALESPFSIHGVFFEEGAFRRMPKSVAVWLRTRIMRRLVN